MGKNNYPFSIDGECRIVPKDPLYSTLQKIEMTGIITLNNNEKYTAKKWPLITLISLSGCIITAYIVLFFFKFDQFKDYVCFFIVSGILILCVALILVAVGVYLYYKTYSIYSKQEKGNMNKQILLEAYKEAIK